MHRAIHLDMTSLPPGPRLPLPVQTWKWIRRPIEFLEDCRARFGATFTVHLPPGRIVCPTRPEDIRTVFAARDDEMHAGEVNRILRVLVGEKSVLVLDGPEHMRQRKLLLPPFHGARMRHYGSTMAEVTRRTVSAWPVGEPLTMHAFTQAITLEIILRTVFGADAGEDLQQLDAQIKRLLRRSENNTALPLMVYLSLHPELERRPPFRWFLAERNRTDALLFDRIARRRGDAHRTERADILSLLIDARQEDGQPMTDREIRDELITALAAGHETTATALAWAFERLLTTPDVLARLREEVRAATSVEDLASAPYLDATIKEVLRLRPVVPIVGRVLQKPATLGGFDLPTGTIVAPNVYLTQRDPALYDDPEAFRPERFLDKQPDPNTWLPFGGGIRRCLGAAFATYEMKVVLGTMLAACDFELAQPVPVRVRRRMVTFWPEQGVRVRVGEKR